MIHEQIKITPIINTKDSKQEIKYRCIYKIITLVYKKVITNNLNVSFETRTTSLLILKRKI